MGAHGLVVHDRGGHATRLPEDARRRWAAGPAPLVGAELEDRRYRLTALLDDLADGTDPIGRAAVAGAVFTDVADLALAVRGRWTGRGRWLARRLRAADEVLARDLHEGFRAALDGDVRPLGRVGGAELDRTGGRLDDGYVRRA